MTAVRGAGLPLGGAGLRTAEYVDFLAAEYLSTYIADGGAAVRFAVTGDDDVTRRWRSGLQRATLAHGGRYVGVDAAETKLSMVDQLYAAVARAVDLPDLVRRTLTAAWADLGLPGDAGLTVAAVAEHHDVDAREAARSIRRQLESTLLADTGLAREFRLAVLRLCQAELGTGDVVEAERDAVLAWLRVEPVALRALRSAALYGRVGRHNARSLLMSLAAWQHGRTGQALVLDLDLTRLAVSRRPPLEERRGLYYTKAAVLDAYELLRQLIDSVDTLRGVLVAVTVPPELVTDELRGFPAYSALQLRIMDEVRDLRRANPYAALVRLDTRLEAVT